MVTAKWDSYKSPNSNSVHNTDGQTRKAGHDVSILM